MDLVMMGVVDGGVVECVNRGFPVPGTGRKHYRYGSQGERAAAKSNRAKREGRWGFKDARRRMRNADRVAGPAHVKLAAPVRACERPDYRDVLGIQVGSAHCSMSGIYVHDRKVVTL